MNFTRIFGGTLTMKRFLPSIFQVQMAKTQNKSPLKCNTDTKDECDVTKLRWSSVYIFLLMVLCIKTRCLHKLYKKTEPFFLTDKKLD